MNKHLTRSSKRISKHKIIRKIIFGSKEKPRVCVFISNKHLYSQAIDDNNHKTIVSAFTKQKTIDYAKQMGKNLANKLKKVKIKNIVFDRSGYKYFGKVEVFANSLRENGISF